MILRNRRPRRPTDQVSPVELLNELLMALRDVIEAEKYLADFDGGRRPDTSEHERACALVQRVCNLYRMLERRADDLATPLAQLSAHTGLDMNQLLSDCLDFPDAIPYVRKVNGMRRMFICYCGEREAVDREGLGLCRECISSALECVREKRKQAGFVIYRSYSPEVRCRHADFDTVLITLHTEGIWPPGWCEMCLLHEKQRIRKLPITQGQIGPVTPMPRLARDD
jgi:hypothetical protein